MLHNDGNTAMGGSNLITNTHAMVTHRNAYTEQEVLRGVLHSRAEACWDGFQKKYVVFAYAVPTTKP